MGGDTSLAASGGVDQSVRVVVARNTTERKHEQQQQPTITDDDNHVREYARLL